MDYSEFLEEWRSEKPYIYAQTSGSTGEPKMIRLDKDFVAESALRTNDFFGIDCKSRLHSCVSPDFIGGKMMAVRAELSGALLTSEKPSNKPFSVPCAVYSQTISHSQIHYEKGESINENSKNRLAGKSIIGDKANNLGEGVTNEDIINLLAVVPSQMIHILEHIEDMPVIKNIIIGGSPINPALRQKIIDSGLNAYETYGMTETASHIALRRIAEGIDYFETLGDITVATDSRGCLVITIPATGNHNEKTTKHLNENSLGGREKEVSVITTNDIAEVVSNRKFRILGRFDNVIITGGKKVNPVEIERLIEEAAINDPQLRQWLGQAFIITCASDEKWGEAVTIRIEDSNLDNANRLNGKSARKNDNSVCKTDNGQDNYDNTDSNTDHSDETLLIGRLKKMLPAYAVPKRIERVARLERTSNGKIVRERRNRG